MKVVVDLTRCQGYAQCAFAAPDVFTMQGDEALMYDPLPDDAQRARIVRAAGVFAVHDPADAEGLWQALAAGPGRVLVIGAGGPAKVRPKPQRGVILGP
jgi:ferredoxin